jgi:large subunit ribosomal protein L7/L12
MAEEKKSPSAKATEEREEKIEVPEKFKKLVEEIEKMSVIDLAELVKILEKKFGVSPMMVPTPSGVGTPTSPGASVGEEKTEFNVELKNAGSQKIQVIKVIQEITGKGLKEAKDLIDGVPKVVKEKVKKEEAEEMKKKLEAAGATVELK